jgi:hypothetical protein
MNDILTKKAFAEMAGVTPSCVSHWIGEKKLHGAAIVGRGCRARIRVPVAIEQLKKNLDISQRTGMNGRARFRGSLDAQKPTASAQEALA